MSHGGFEVEQRLQPFGIADRLKGQLAQRDVGDHRFCAAKYQRRVFATDDQPAAAVADGAIGEIAFFDQAQADLRAGCR
ncbi:hypothetical protein D3C80_2081000 [compost metagenome]